MSERHEIIIMDQKVIKLSAKKARYNKKKLCKCVCVCIYLYTHTHTNMLPTVGK